MFHLLHSSFLSPFQFCSRPQQYACTRALITSRNPLNLRQASAAIEVSSALVACRKQRRRTHRQHLHVAASCGRTEVAERLLHRTRCGRARNKVMPDHNEETLPRRVPGRGCQSCSHFSDTGPPSKSKSTKHSYLRSLHERNSDRIAALLSHFKPTSPDIHSHPGSIGTMRHEAKLIGLAAVLLPTLAALHFDHLRSRETETALVQGQHRESSEDYRLYDHGTCFAARGGATPRGKSETACSSPRGFDTWQEVKKNRRNCLATLAQSFQALSRLEGNQEIHIARSLQIGQACRQTESLF